MELPEERIHSFIVRIWLEENAVANRASPSQAQLGQYPIADPKPVRWQGHITHVLSNQRAYVTSLAQINRFMAGYLHPLATDEDLG